MQKITNFGLIGLDWFSLSSKLTSFEAKLTSVDVKILSVERREITSVHNSSVTIYETASMNVVGSVPTQSISVSEIHRVFSSNLETGAEDVFSLPSNIDVREGTILRLFMCNGNGKSIRFACKNMDTGRTVEEWTEMLEIINGNPDGPLPTEEMDRLFDIEKYDVGQRIISALLDRSGLYMFLWTALLWPSMYFILEGAILSFICTAIFIMWRTKRKMKKDLILSSSVQTLHKTLRDFIAECSNEPPIEEKSKNTA